MSRESNFPERTVIRLLYVVVGGLAMSAAVNRRSRAAAAAPLEAPADAGATRTRVAEPAAAPRRRPARMRRVALAASFAVLLAAGGTMTAVGADQAAKFVAPEDVATETVADAAPPADAPAPDASPTEPTAEPDAAPAPAPAPPAEAAPASTPDALPVAATDDAPAQAAAPSEAAPSGAAPASATSTAAPSAESAPASAASGPAAASSAPAASVEVATSPAVHRKLVRLHVQRVLRQTAPLAAAPPDPETRAPFTASTIWLNRATVDPTPPSVRLDRSWLRAELAAAKASGADWALVLGVLRAEGFGGRTPAPVSSVRDVAQRLGVLTAAGKDDWAAAAAVAGDTARADRAVAIANYDRAVGTEALVEGLRASKHRLVAKILNDPSISIYDGGRSDLQQDKVDVRVVAVIAYLRQTFGSVEVSCLISGHHLFARPGVISAHIYGQAVDVAALGGVSIYGNQEPGGVTEKAVRALLFLPGEVEPKQIISLLGLGGPSFPLADHDDHIHVGF